MSNCCIHAYVSGRVQGVWFRAFTRDQAQQHHVSGWAKNLSDGRVEVLLEGSRPNVDDVLKALEKGPPLAKVKGLEQEETSCRNLTGFTIE